MSLYSIIKNSTYGLLMMSAIGCASVKDSNHADKTGFNKNEFMERSFYNSDSSIFKINVSKSEYTNAKRIPRETRNNAFEDFVVVNYKFSSADGILDGLNLENLNNEKKAQKILDFVTTNHKYVNENIDYIKAPVETLVDGVGDCEDLTFLTYALMKKAGIDCSLIASYTSFEGHSQMGVMGNFDGYNILIKDTEASGKKYFIVESTKQSKIGEFGLPSHTKSATIYAEEKLGIKRYAKSNMSLDSAVMPKGM